MSIYKNVIKTGTMRRIIYMRLLVPSVSHELWVQKHQSMRTCAIDEAYCSACYHWEQRACQYRYKVRAKCCAALSLISSYGRARFHVACKHWCTQYFTRQKKISVADLNIDSCFLFFFLFQNYSAQCAVRVLFKNP